VSCDDCFVLFVIMFSGRWRRRVAHEFCQCRRNDNTKIGDADDVLGDTPS
jgi:hypothetical protein